MKRLIIFFIFILMLMLIFIFLISARVLAPPPRREIRIDNNNLNLSNILSNQNEIINSIRDGLRSHSAGIQIKFSYDKPDIGGSGLRELKELCAYWIEEALKETDDPTEGDYIRYQYGGYRLVCRRGKRDSISGKYIYTAEIIPEYYLYYTQEEEVTAKLTELFDNFAFTNETTDYEKIRVIYDYICQNVKYDLVHKNNARYHVKSTAYAALILHSATCQGYCAALYRILRQAGVPDCHRYGHSAEQRTAGISRVESGETKQSLVLFGRHMGFRKRRIGRIFLFPARSR